MEVFCWRLPAVDLQCISEALTSDLSDAGKEG